MWLSACGDLLHDARRDLADIGALAYEGVRLLDLKSVKAGQRGLSGLPGEDLAALEEREGVGRRGRQQQLRVLLGQERIVLRTG